ncbi:peptide ABC transporter substrate-binding protein [Clostridiales bacterium PH28_bin88]|nr:peptide ABC transporter substrate-binding protein [Clostridiales bacterium PH28_bin88]
MVLMFVLTVAGCGGKKEAGNQPSQEAQISDILVVGMSDSILTLDPAMHRDRNTETVIRNMFDGLVTRTPDGKIVPEIAESYTQLSPTVWEFKIRRGITFHNGDPLTADDVKFTFDRLITEGFIDGKTSPRKGLLGSLESVEKVDDYTVRLNLAQPWPILLRMLPHQQIVPKKYLEEKGNAYFADNPIGAGPFKFVEGKLDERIVMERYEGYYGGSPEIPPIEPARSKRVIFEIIPETSTRVAALQSGKVHIIQNVPTDMVEQLKASPEIDVKMAEGTRVYMIEMNVTRAPFDNVKVRQALNYAVDMDQIVQKVLGGYATVLAGPNLQNSFAINTDLKPYGYDPEKAKQLLKEAGYEKGFNMVFDTTEEFKDVAEAVATYLRQVGINATVRIWDWGVLKPLLEKGERQLIMSSWGNSTQDPYDFMIPKLKTKDRGNYSLYSNNRVDKLLDEASVTMDEAKRADMYKEAQEIVYNDAPWIFGYSKKEIEGSLKGVQNWVPSSDSRINLHDVYLLKK